MGKETLYGEKSIEVTDDPMLFYAAEITLQLYMVESSEQIRDLYAAAYSMPESSALIMRNIAGKLTQLDSGMDTTGN
ncbi:MAG: hypothetical protein IKL23_06930 [Oscillospiraceae bacterium]|nr:hypothetical protein [Oscillospiraceae bacterium]